MPATFLIFLVGLPAVFFTMVGAAYPIARILDRMGFPQHQTLLYYIPFLNVYFIWRLAFAEWPIERSRASEVFG